MVTKITLVRHGQSTGNAAECFTGQTDVALSPTGIEQAKLTAMALANESFTAIYSSDLQRARITAQIIADAHNLEVKEDPNLREINLGIFQGKSFKEVAQNYPQEFQAISRRDPDVVIPQGESHAMLRNRVISSFNEIISRHNNGHILLVIHGGVIFHINHYILGINPKDNFKLSYKISNCSIHRYELLEEARWRIVSLNDESHLPKKINSTNIKSFSDFSIISEQIFGCS
jgi:broad specificity phosphatase PhoE